MPNDAAPRHHDQAPFATAERRESAGIRQEPLLRVDWMATPPGISRHRQEGNTITTLVNEGMQQLRPLYAGVLSSP